MHSSWLGNLVKSSFSFTKRSRQRPKAKRVVFRKLELERLEDRLAPATAVWTGAAGDGMWTNPVNWNGGVAPSPGDDLVFPNGVAILTTTNDFATGTAFSTITINGNGYVLNGNAIFLTGGSITSSHTNTNATNTINFSILATSDFTIENIYPTTHLTLNGPLDLSAHTVTVTGAGRVNLQGAISGSGSTALIKQDIGLLFMNQNNTYTGTVFVNEGILVAQNQALGSALSGTVVADGASLGTHGNLNLEPITVSGQGFGGVGAFGILPNTHGTAWATGTFSGNLNLVGDTLVNVRATQTLTVTGTVSGNGSLTVQDLGILNFANTMTYTGATIINGGRIQMSGNLGALINTPSIEVNLGGSLFIDNNAGPNPAPQRLPNDVDIYLNDGSTIFYQINNVAGRIQEERVGNIFIGPGHNRIQITPANQGSPAQSRLFATSLQRTGPGAIVKFESTIAAARDLGTAFNQVLFDNAPPLTNGIIPWVIVNNTGGGNLMPGTYDPINGIRAIQTGEFVTDINTAGPTDNVVLTAGATLTADTTVNSLTIRTTGGGITLNLNGFTLTIAGEEDGSGPVRGLLLTTNPTTTDNRNVVINGGGTGVLTFGPTGEGIIDFNTFQNNTNLDGTNVTRLVDLTISEAAFLTLGSSWKHDRAGNIPGLDLRNVTGTYSGTTLLTQGQVGLRQANVITIPGDFIIGTDGSTTAANAASRAYVRWFNSNKVANTANVTVANNGQLDLITSSLQETINDLTLMVGYFTPANGHASGGNPATNTNALNVNGTLRVVSPNDSLNSITLIPARLNGRINITSDTSFDIDNTPALYELEVLGPMVSSGSFEKNGDGVVILRNTAINAYQFPGDIFVNEGTLSVDLSVNITTNVNLGPDASFHAGRVSTATGTVLNLNTSAGSIIRPGQLTKVLGAPGTGVPFGVNSIDGIGIMRTATTDLSEAMLEIQVKNLITVGTHFDQLQATGSVTLGPNSTLVADLRGLQDVTSAQLPIVTSATLNGTRFGNIQVLNNPNGYVVFPTYTDTTVFLNIIKANVPVPLNDIYAIAPGVGTAG
ncbi:MAG: beta strand repeat-containing protein, partial [Gemmataceae bacterium]